MSLYTLLKVVHILSSTLLFGTGLGTAFFMWFTWRSGNLATIAAVSRLTVRADWLFTTPAVLVQPITGIALIKLMGFPWTTAWLQAAIALYLLAGACWLPVVYLQWRVRDLATTALATDSLLSPASRRYMRWWFVLGWPAFIAVLAIFWLMVAKPALWS
ncbi:DUF2269 family protein [Frateuria defendens]|uniref:DUF2269 family protein n=1 Tax=Frateuria defendens TaxID=2219559 RepID=UPI00066FC974|nr:DUF2269 domain-containing protein [Frateuria defendens]